MELLCEKDLAQRMHEEVWPTLSAARREVRVRAADGTELFAVLYTPPAPRGSVVLLHGLGETAEKYRELCYYFFKSSLTVLIFDQRGHGRSGRAVSQQLIWVDRFEHYVDDLFDLLRHLGDALPAPRYLYAHSMGGAVAAMALAREGHGFARAVLSSPMIAMQYRNVPRAFGYTLSGLMRLVRRGKRSFPFVGAPATPDTETLARSGATSAERHDLYRKLKYEDERLHACAVTNDWMWEALRCTHSILARGVPERITTPVRIYAPEHEELVLEGPQRELAARLPQGEFIRVDNAKHELYMTKDPVFAPYVREILSFFEDANV